MGTPTQIRRVKGQDPEELKRRIGRNVAAVRKEQGISQQGFAGLLGTSVQWVSRVERGEENLTITTLVKLAGALGLTVEDLFRTEE